MSPKRIIAYRWITCAVTAILVVSAVPCTVAEEKTPRSNDVFTKHSGYPLDHCIVTGEKLGGMGDPVIKTYDGREVRFCCAGCVKTFEKDRKKWMKKLDDAIVASQKASYPLETCVVSGEKLGVMSDPVDYVYRNRLVRFCCKGCIATFNAEPDKYLHMLDEAELTKTAPAPEPAVPSPTP